MRLPKYHGLGNDYFVYAPAENQHRRLTPDLVRRICDRHTGAGSDGILEGPFFRRDNPDELRAISPDTQAPCGVRIWNPDGSEAEKSGNGARIFTRYLFDKQIIAPGEKYTFATRGGDVSGKVAKDCSQLIECSMGHLQFSPHRDFPGHEDYRIAAGDRTFSYCPVSIGNPHCVVLDSEATAETAMKYGPLLETAERFPNRINVQFLQVIDEHTIRIEIWERGAGYTLASGTSSCAAAAVAIHEGHCTSPVTVMSPGGKLKVEIDKQWNATLTGPVEFVYIAEIP